MINGVSFNPNIIKSHQKQNASVTQPSFEENREMPSEISTAYRAYGQAMIQKPLEQLSLNDCILQLQKQGKVEGKDYRIDGCTMGNIVLHVNNKDGQQTKVLHFDNGDIEKCSCREEYKYENGRKVKEIHYHSNNNKVSMYSDCYYNDEIPQEAFTKDKLTYDTTPEQCIEYLNKNNINYKIERDGEGDNNRSLYITEFDDNGKQIQSTWFYYGENTFDQKHQMLSRSIYNNNELETKRIELEKDCTSVCTYLEQL